MSIKFLVGRSGVGKTYKVLEKIVAECNEAPDGDPIFIISPEQMNFTMDYAILKKLNKPSTFRIQGLSFHRLAYRILQETGGLARHHLDDVGLALLLQKVMNEQKDKLSLFQNYSGKPGFIEKVAETFTEFKSYGVNSQNLLQSLERGQASGLSQKSAHKLQDLALIYEEFSQTALNKYLLKEDYYDMLFEAIETSTTIQHADFYVDGYHYFNKQEELILLKLMEHAKSVTLLLTHNPDSKAQLFSLPRQTLSRLEQQAKEAGLTYKIQTLQPGPKDRLSHQNAISHLEKHFLQGASPDPQGQGIHFYAASNKRIEVEEAARRIHRLVLEEGCSYSDIAIYTGDTSDYDELIAGIFPKFNIPFFLDYKESMLHHPLISFLYHLFDLVLHGWRHEALFTLIKTGLFLDVSGFKQGQSYFQAFQTYMAQVDILENYCLARHIYKAKWLQDEPWEYVRYKGLGQGYVKTDDDAKMEIAINKIRLQIAKPLHALETCLKKAPTYKKKAICLFEFLEDLQVPQKLALMEESQEELQKKKQNEQVWNRLLSLFEQLAEIGNDQAVSNVDFASVFKAGLEKMNFITVPPALDQVAIGQLRRARYQLVNDWKEPGQYGFRHGFLLGVNEGQIPQIHQDSSLIGEVEREALQALGIELAPTLEQAQLHDLFTLYTVLTSPKETLTLSYAISNDEGKEFLPSYIWSHLKSLFPNAEVAHIGREQDSDVYAHLTTVGRSVSHLISVLKKSPHLKSYYEPLLSYYEKEHPLIAQMVNRILGYKNEAKALDTDLAKDIYGAQINASVSRLELFNQCHFSHYVRYGLGLRERELYKLDLPHIGEMYHEALKRIATRIQEEGRTFADLSKKECKTLAELASNEIGEQLLFQILKRSKRMSNLTERLTQVVYKTLIGLKYQGKQSAFKPTFFELPFGTQKDSGIRLKQQPLDNGFQLALRGIVDRIDVAKKDGDTYVRVVDYKSSKKELTLDSIYYGLSLQLLTYLDVVLSNSLELLGAPAKSAGLLYFHVHRPFLSQNDELLSQEDVESIIEELHYKEYKMNGYLPEDLEVAILSDQRLEAGQTSSDIVPITLKKDGSFSAKGNRLLKPENLDLLREFTRGKIKGAALDITQGKIDINPTKYGDRTACDFCPYKGICQFDPDLKGNTARILAKLPPEDALEKMREEVSP